MKKVLKYFGIAILVILALIIITLIRAAFTPAVPKDYANTVKTGGDMEAAYLKNGDHSVAYYEEAADKDLEKYEVWYPEDLGTSDRVYPVIVVLNGTGVKASKYKAQFEHFASHGFITIGTEEKEAWDAVAADRSLAWLFEQNEAVGSIFHQKVDVDNIGVVGHSQGGAGVFNAITVMEHSSYYKAAVSVSPTHEEQSIALKWSYDLSKIDIPIFMVAGTKGSFEMELVLPEQAMRDMYDKISAPKVMARKKDCEHGQMLYSADGYITAWFLWKLQGDSAAARVFTGADPELLQNTLYQEQRIDLEK